MYNQNITNPNKGRKREHVMKEVKSPKKPLIYYYGVAILVIFLFNMIVSPLLMKGQIKEVDYGTFMSMIGQEYWRSPD